MKHISKISLFCIFAISACNTISFCEDSEESSKLKYLELRGLNYDYVHFYKKSEDHKDKEEYQKSQENALQYKKKLNSYLIKSPGIKSLQDPNGYFSSDDKLGFNPLKEESINSIFKAKPYLVENGSHFFVSKQKDEFSDLDIQEPKELEEVAGFSDNDFELQIDEGSFAFDEDGLPIVQSDNSSDFTAKSFSGEDIGGSDASQSQNLQSNDRSTDDQDQSELEDPTNPKQIRFNKGVHRLHNGVERITKSIKHLNIAMKRYKDYINSENVHPDKVTLMRDRLQMHISRLHRVNGVLKGYNHGLTVAGRNNDLEGLQQLHKIHKHQLATENLLDNETQNFERLMEETGNAYRFIPPESIDTAFVPKDQENNRPTDSFGVPVAPDSNGPIQQNNDGPFQRPPVEANDGWAPGQTKPGTGKPNVDIGISDTVIKPLPVNPDDREMSGQKPGNLNLTVQPPNGPNIGTTIVPNPNVVAPQPAVTAGGQQKPNPIPPTKPNVDNSDQGNNSGKIPCLWWPGKLMGRPKPSTCI
ncbi:MAG: hypothetical protein KC646_08935 [Candidatus Cloacimonetes bacterium]|nr:hypothetical protein [Candidatus Cloacimonadota bacterium]